MPQTLSVIDRPKHLAPSFPQLRSITHPSATIAGVSTIRYHVEARLIDSDGFATDTLREFDVLVPAHLGNDAIERLLKTVTEQRYQVRSKVPQSCSAF